MTQDHTLAVSRYEVKYLIRNSLALRIREFIQQHLDLDEYGTGRPNLSYPVHSLYLDSDDWKIYWRTVNGDQNRFKLRIRYYNDDPGTPAFWEIKRRMNDVILKQRCGIRRSEAPHVLAGHLPMPAEMVAPDNPRELHAVQEFLRLQHGLGAGPKMHVAYEREAYVGRLNHELRLTFDRNVRVCTRLEPVLTTAMAEPFTCTGPGTNPADVVILELKFATRFPGFFRELVETFELSQTGAAKYVEGTTLYANRQLNARDVIRHLVL